MGGVVKKIFGIKKPTGPSEGQLAAQTDAQNRANEQRAEADRLAALSSSIGSRRKQLDYMKSTLGG